MPRKLRIQEPNLTYHITSRCIEWRTLLDMDIIKDNFIEVIRLTQEKYHFELSAYQIMDNHFHLIIKTSENGQPISRIVQYIKARFAERYNRQMDRIGPFWNERYHDSIIEHAENPGVYLLWLLWYLAFNPVRKKITDNPRKYPYGSIHCYLSMVHKSPIKITLHQLFTSLGNTVEDRMYKFLSYEDAYRRRIVPVV